MLTSVDSAVAEAPPIVGRIHTVARTPRPLKPRVLREHPELEVTDVLGMVTEKYARSNCAFQFIQIGAYDGRTGDPLHHLVEHRGWRGLLVEARPGPFAALQRNYAGQGNLKFFNVAIGAENSTLTICEESGVVLSEQVEAEATPATSVSEVVAPCWTFERLLEEAQWEGAIDLLQIDAEGYDYEIIRSIDLKKYRPTILRYEHRLLDEERRNACLELLAEHGYRFLLEEGDTIAIQCQQSGRTSVEEVA